MKSKKSGFYDFGSDEENMKRYGQAVPPEMNLTKVREANIPITMYSMKHDVMLSVEESRKTKQLLGDHVESVELNGGHSTYFVGKDMSFVNDGILSRMSELNPIK